MASIYANLLEQKKAFAQEKNSTPTGLVWDTNMAAVLLFWDTNMAAMTSCENTLLNHLNWATLSASDGIVTATTLRGGGMATGRMGHFTVMDWSARWMVTLFWYKPSCFIM